MRKLFFAAFLFLSLTATAHAGFDYPLYAECLSKYVSTGRVIDGVTVNAVDYRAVVSDSKDPSSAYSRVISKLASFDPGNLKTRDEKAAFWINAYNIAAINLVVKNYPVDSIRSGKISFLRSPWGKDAITVGGKAYSLGEIEHGILMKELAYPMAHFGIVCASVSCPDLQPVPFTPDGLEKQLDAAAHAFINDPQKGARIEHNTETVFISRIFDWGAEDFDRLGGTDEVLYRFLIDKSARSYVESDEYVYEYMDYDWKLNDTRFAE